MNDQDPTQYYNNAESEVEEDSMEITMKWQCLSCGKEFEEIMDNIVGPFCNLAYECPSCVDKRNAASKVKTRPIDSSSK